VSFLISTETADVFNLYVALNPAPTIQHDPVFAHLYYSSVFNLQSCCCRTAEQRSRLDNLGASRQPVGADQYFALRVVYRADREGSAVFLGGKADRDSRA